MHILLKQNPTKSFYYSKNKEDSFVTKPVDDWFMEPIGDTEEFRIYCIKDDKKRYLNIANMENNSIDAKFMETRNHDYDCNCVFKLDDDSNLLTRIITKPNTWYSLYNKRFGFVGISTTLLPNPMKLLESYHNDYVLK